MASKKKKATKGASRDRFERRFLPQSAHAPTIVRVAGGLGAALLGAGTYAFFAPEGVFDGHDALAKLPQWLVAGGSLLTGAAIWLGTSSDPAVRVGDPGVALEKGDLWRMPWHRVEKVRWDDSKLALLVEGTKEGGGKLEVKLPVATQPHAAAWALDEARERIPDRVDVPDGVAERLGAPSREVGTLIKLDPLQVVGQRCAETQKLIAFDADARVCPRCELVFHKVSARETCLCGADLREVFKKSKADVERETAAEASA